MSRILLLITAEDRAGAERSVLLGQSPRKDYLELARVLGADVLDLSNVHADATARRLDRFVRRGAGHAWLASRLASRYETIFSDGEHIGLLLGVALARKRYRPRHIMIGHSLSARKKRPLAALAREGIDNLIVHSDAQLEFAINTLRFDPADVYLLPYQVDVDFWQRDSARQELMIASAGLEQRDYATFLDAVKDLPLGAIMAGASHWSRTKNRLNRKKLPANTILDSYDYLGLRDLYSRARMVVVPVRDVDFQAGITTILEAMAMRKAVIVTHARGQRETVVGPLWAAGQTTWPSHGPSPEGCTGIYVPPRDAEALRSAIVYLVERPEVAAVLGTNGRRRVEERLSIDRYVRSVASVIDPALAQASGARTDALSGA